MSKYATKLISCSPYAGRIHIIPGKIEEVTIPEQVDIIISEPMGYMLYNERMLESFVFAKKFLKTGGLMFPSLGDLYCAPFHDEQLHVEQYQKASFWCMNSFHGVDLTHLRDDAIKEYFSQPIVDQINIDSLLCHAVRHRMDFRLAKETDFEVIQIPFEFTATRTNLVHGFAFWFDVCFCGHQTDVWLSTAPTEELTHWYQVRCLLSQPLFARVGETIKGFCKMTANKRQSYDIIIEASVVETGIISRNSYDLKNPFFRYNGQQSTAPPGNHKTISPSNTLHNGTTIHAVDNNVRVNENTGHISQQEPLVSNSHTPVMTNGSFQPYVSSMVYSNQWEGVQNPNS